MAAPTVGPNPGTMLTTPGGNPTWKEIEVAFRGGQWTSIYHRSRVANRPRAVGCLQVQRPPHWEARVRVIRPPQGPDPGGQCVGWDKVRHNPCFQAALNPKGPLTKMAVSLYS